MTLNLLRLTRGRISPCRGAQDLIATCLLAVAVICHQIMPAAAQSWPAKSVRIISPFAAGGSSDIMARILAEYLSERFAQRFIIENRGGAGGIVGSAYVAGLPPDGYTFLVASIATHVTSPATSANPGYHPVTSFVQVAFIGGPPTVIIAHPSLGAKSLPELIGRLKGGEETTYVSPGPGTVGHMIAEYLAGKEGLKLTHLSYRGAGQAIVDLVGGHVKLGSITWSAALGQMRAGKITPLAVSSARRMPGFPNVPTLSELGYPELVVTTWFGFVAPAGLPAPIIERMNAVVGDALATPAIRARLENEGFELTPMSSSQFEALVKADIEKWVPLAKRLNPPDDSPAR